MCSHYELVLILNIAGFRGVSDVDSLGVCVFLTIPLLSLQLCGFVLREALSTWWLNGSWVLILRKQWMSFLKALTQCSGRTVI